MSVIELPPIRQLFRPDPGFVMVDADFDRADAQIVAWESDEPALKQIFQAGTDIHTENAAWIYNKCPADVQPDERQRVKSVTHALHYGAKERTLASTAGVPVARMEDFSRYWFDRFPGIRRWHSHTIQRLRLTHCVHNVWGFRRFYFDRPDGLLPQALAWIGQSSVSITINKAMLRIHRELPEAQLLLQVHDSLLLQVPSHLCPAIFPRILATMQVEIPYPDPLTIPVSLKFSHLNWGSMEKWGPPAASALGDTP